MTYFIITDEKEEIDLNNKLVNDLRSIEFYKRVSLGGRLQFVMDKAFLNGKINFIDRPKDRKHLDSFIEQGFGKYEVMLYDEAKARFSGMKKMLDSFTKANKRETIVLITFSRVGKGTLGKKYPDLFIDVDKIEKMIDYYFVIPGTLNNKVIAMNPLKKFGAKQKEIFDELGIKKVFYFIPKDLEALAKRHKNPNNHKRKSMYNGCSFEKIIEIYKKQKTSFERDMLPILKENFDVKTVEMEVEKFEEFVLSLK